MIDTAVNVSVLCVVAMVQGVAQLHDVVYIICWGSSTIFRFNSTTHQRLPDIDKELKELYYIVACERTSQLYVSDNLCIWRVSSDGKDMKRCLPKSSSDTFIHANTLSVTSTRLLVATHFPSQLIQFDSDGDELRRVQLPDDMRLRHAVESPTGTFIVSRDNEQYQVVEVNTGGEVLRQFRCLPSFRRAEHIAVDSHGNIFVVDLYNNRILLLDAHLSLRRVIIDEDQLNYKQPVHLCYREQSGQLLVGLYNGSVAVFDGLCR